MGMSQEAFVKRYQGRWLDLDEMLDRLEKGDLDRPVDDFPERYQQACRHLAVARYRGYSPGVRVNLERLVARGHTILYQHRPGPWEKILGYVAGGFARDVRKNWAYLLAATVAFVLPFAVMMGWIYLDPEVALDVLGEDMVFQLDAMYGSPFGDGDRGSEDDVMMFGFYIYNNVGIALRTFGAGVMFGLGSLAIILFNGLFIGAASGYVTAMGYGDQFWPFVIGHGSFELTAIVLAGMAGLKVGAAPIWPGRRGRIDAIREAARDSVGIILGFSVMLIIAAFIEAFWSPRAIDASIRYGVGAVLWAVVILYFALAGRSYRGTR